MVSQTLFKYDTDKVRKTINGVEFGHTYGEVYDEVFNSFKNPSVLEIGVDRGGSLLAWREYSDDVTGVDISDNRKPKYVSDLVKFIKSDIRDYKPDRNFDIIIDDGSHYIDDVVFVVKNFLTYLNTNGVLIIEDVQDGETWTSAILANMTDGYEFTAKDLRKRNGVYDDFIIIIKKL